MKLRTAWKSAKTGLNTVEILLLAMGFTPSRVKSDYHSHLRQVVLHKSNAASRLGIVFKMTNGTDQKVVFPVINMLSKDGLAAQSKALLPGDELLAVNGQCALTNYEACQLLREADADLQLVMRRRRQPPEMYDIKTPPTTGKQQSL